MTRLKPTLLALSASGLLAIAGYEGYSATAYKDTGGISTVGFRDAGHGCSGAQHAREGCRKDRASPPVVLR